MNMRQKQQQVFDDSESNIIVGDVVSCPISPKQLAETTAQSEYVVETFDSGLTAEVFRIRIDNQDFTLKKRRKQAKVRNLDGHFSFLNEVQRRADFEVIKRDQANLGCADIVNTVYADYRLGIILSDWIEGDAIEALSFSQLERFFATLMMCEQHGLFEWDLCSGNLLVDNNGYIKLFDFGYMYPFDPKREFNSNGVSDPLFNFCERFETRFLSGWLLEGQYSNKEALEIFSRVRRAALKAIENKIEWLFDQGAEQHIVNYYRGLRAQFREALSSDEALQACYLLSMFRSHVLDIEDDLEGKSCTPLTLKRIEVVQTTLNEHYPMLKNNGALFYHNDGLSLEELTRQYQNKYQLAKQYQLV
ncbi:phosphotransferase [Vibrio sp. JPW-9-11-11]|uniref:phosphotransferase n=1 Tax=Vibrio sp. JPW-9-11-11 TaxID=1416532 RepID=UPI0015948E90|nr:phosphotransferase [Vibrio sp. JPW-9-11-11]NVD06803.1 phosphotransferase [Vibrio sp. JPW-9-11-11]